MVKRWVLRCDRKTSNEGVEVTCCGKLFQIWAAATGKTRSPTVDSRVSPTISDDDEAVPLYHSLNGSSSPVLTATHNSYGRFCEFLGFFLGHPCGSQSNRSPNKMAQTTWIHARMCLLEQNCYFCSLWLSEPPKFGQFWSGLKIYARFRV